MPRMYLNVHVAAEGSVADDRESARAEAQRFLKLVAAFVATAGDDDTRRELYDENGNHVGSLDYFWIDDETDNA